MMYWSQSKKGPVVVEEMGEYHLLNAARKLRRRLAASADRDAAEVAHDRTVLTAMEARASAMGWGKAAEATDD